MAGRLRTIFREFAGIPARRLLGPAYRESGDAATAAPPATGGAEAQRLAASADAAAAIAAHRLGPGWDAYSALPAALRPAVSNPAAFTVLMNQLIRDDGGARSQTVCVLIMNRRDVAGEVAAAALPYVTGRDQAGARAAVDRIIGPALARARGIAPGDQPSL